MPEKAEDMRSMQEEAIRRVQEMQRRSQSYIGGSGSGTDTDTVSVSSDTGAPSSSSPSPSSSSSSSSALFDIAGIKLDEEKALIGLLIYVLYKNNADMKLILALGYLLL